jgi:glycosyltransferase involved in cell wall biosynthesis
MFEPMVSVIIPSHNRSHLLPRAVASVRRQTYSNWELIVVDDGSTDGTEDVVRAIDDPRISYVRHERNRGACAARNTGFSRASGDFVAWLDSDDEWREDKLEAQLRVFENNKNPDLGAVTCGVIFSREDGSTTTWMPVHKDRVVERLLRQERVGIGPQYLLVKKEFLLVPDPLLFDENMPARQDLDFAVRLLKRCQLDFVPEPLVTIHHHGGERVWTPERSIKTDLYFHEKYREDLQANPIAHNRHHLRTAATCIAMGRWQDARAQVEEARKAFPRDLLTYAWLALVRSGRNGKPSRLRSATLRVLRRMTFRG